MRLLRRCLWVFACAAVAGAGPALAELRLTRSVSLSETFSDNVNQEPEGEEEEALISDGTAILNLRYQAARANAAFDSATTLRYQTGGRDEGAQLLPHLSGFGSVEVSKDLFFVDASASISRQLLSTRERDIEANRDTVQNYRLSPYLVGRFGGFARSLLRYSVDTTVASGADLTNSVRQAVTAALDSGSDFTRLLWALNASASRSSRSETDDVTRASAAMDVEYVVDRTFSLLGSIGYQLFDDQAQDNEFASPTWEVGFRWKPGPRTSLRGTYGRRDNEESFEGDLTYQIGPRTTLVASYAERLSTGEERLIRDLTFIGIDTQTGELIDTRTGLLFDPNTAATSVVDQTERTRTFRLAGRATRGRNNFQLSGTVEMSEEEGGAGPADEEMAYSLGGSWSRQLSRFSALNVNGHYARHEFELDDRTDDEFRASGTFSYVVYRSVRAFAAYQYNQQFSTNEADEFTENRVTLGVHMAF